MTSFTARTDRHLVRANGRSRRHVLLTLTAPKPRRKPAQRPPVNVAFVLDRSGSMGGGKIGLAKYAVERALQGLSTKDRLPARHAGEDDRPRLHPRDRQRGQRSGRNLGDAGLGRHHRLALELPGPGRELRAQAERLKALSRGSQADQLLRQR